jgi:hypothetical protein
MKIVTPVNGNHSAGSQDFLNGTDQVDRWLPTESYLPPDARGFNTHIKASPR